MKFLRVSLSILLLFVAIGVARGEGDERVTAQIRAFYQWYIPLLESAQDKEIVKHHRKEMSRYVTANRLASIARIKAGSQEGDYFVGSLDSDPAWTKNITVSHIKIDAKGHATAEVSLTGGTAANVHLKVILTLEDGTYKIDALENLPDYPGMAAAQLKAFYEQYLHYLAHSIGDETPLGHQDIQDGLTGAGLLKANTKGRTDAKFDYLLQAPTWDPAWEQHVEVKRVEIAPDGTHGTAEVLLTADFAKMHLKVSLKHEKDAFRIDGVETIND